VLDFDGATSVSRAYWHMGDAGVIGYGDFTFEGYFQVPPLGSTRSILALTPSTTGYGPNAFYINVDNLGRLDFYLVNVNGADTVRRARSADISTGNVGRWRHLAVVRMGDNLFV